MEIREYKLEDWFDLISVSKDEWKGPIVNLCRSVLKDYDGKITKILVAHDDKELLGFIYGFILPNSVLIPEFMYVKPEHRKKGLAHSLLRELEIQSGCETSIIFYNKALHDFYENQGYETGSELETAIKNLI